VTIVLGIAVLWLLAGAAWFVVFWVLSRRPVTATERRCAEIDRELSRQSLNGGRERADRGHDHVVLRAI
jgi:hypothetical protein